MPEKGGILLSRSFDERNRNAGGKPPWRVESSEGQEQISESNSGCLGGGAEADFSRDWNNANMALRADSENKPPPPASLRPGQHQLNPSSAPAGDSGYVTCIPLPSMPPPLEVVPGRAGSEGSWAGEPGRPRGVSPERRARSQSLERGRG